MCKTVEVHKSERFNYLMRVEKGGHRFFQCKKTGRIAVADESGDTRIGWGTPEMTEDGVLWLDTTREIEVERYGDERECVSLPLLCERDDNRPTSTPISFSSALYLAERFNMKIKTGINSYSVERTSRPK